MVFSLTLPATNKEFPFLNSLISVPPERQLYNSIRGRYLLRAIEQLNAAEKDYSRFDGLDDLCKMGNEWGYSYIKPVIVETVDELVRLGVYDIDLEGFIQKYYQPFDVWHESFSSIQDKYFEIVLEGDQLNQYRNVRKQHRGKFVGGGFGLSGAVAGATQAGALNLATGILHSGFNLVGKAFTAMAHASKKEKIFKDPKTKMVLLNSIFDSVLKSHMSLLLALYENNISGSDIISDEDVQKADRVFSNLKRGAINKESFEQIFSDLIILNPYNEYLYQFIIESYGDKNRNIEDIANYFNIDIVGYKIKSACQFYQSLDVSTKDKFMSSKLKLDAYCENIGLIDFKPLDFLNKIQTSFNAVYERRERIYNGVVYDSIDELSEVKKEEDIIFGIINQKIPISASKNTTYKVDMDQLIIDLLGSKDYNEVKAFITDSLKSQEEKDTNPSLSEIMRNKKLIDSQNSSQKWIHEILKKTEGYVGDELDSTRVLDKAIDNKLNDVNEEVISQTLLALIEQLEGEKLHTAFSLKIIKHLKHQYKKNDLISRTFQGEIYPTIIKMHEAQERFSELQKQKHEQELINIESEKDTISGVDKSISFSAASRSQVVDILERLNQLKPKTKQAREFLLGKLERWYEKQRDLAQLDINSEINGMSAYLIGDKKLSIKEINNSLKSLQSFNTQTIEGGEYRNNQIKKCQHRISEIKNQRKKHLKIVRNVAIFVALVVVYNVDYDYFFNEKSLDDTKVTVTTNKIEATSIPTSEAVPIVANETVAIAAQDPTDKVPEAPPVSSSEAVILQENSQTPVKAIETPSLETEKPVTVVSKIILDDPTKESVYQELYASNSITESPPFQTYVERLPAIIGHSSFTTSNGEKELAFVGMHKLGNESTGNISLEFVMYKKDKDKGWTKVLQQEGIRYNISPDKYVDNLKSIQVSNSDYIYYFPVKKRTNLKEFVVVSILVRKNQGSYEYISRDFGLTFNAGELWDYSFLNKDGKNFVVVRKETEVYSVLTVKEVSDDVRGKYTFLEDTCSLHKMKVSKEFTKNTCEAKGITGLTLIDGTKAK